MIEEPKPRCPDCGNSVIHDPEKDEYVCRTCGLVVDDYPISRVPAWNTYNWEKRIHSGAQESVEVHDKGLPTVIGMDTRDAHGNKLTSSKEYELFRLRRLQRRTRIHTCLDRSLTTGLREIALYTDKLRLPEGIREKVAVLYRQALEKNLVQGRPIAALTASVVYFVCRQNNAIRSLKEVSEATGIPKKQVAQYYRMLIRKLDLYPPTCSPTSYVLKIAAQLNIPGELQGKAIRLLNSTKTSGKDPKGLAAGALYLVGKDDLGWGCITQKALAKAAGTTEMTVRNRYKFLKRQRGD